MGINGNQSERILKVKERIQVGSVYLFKFDCPGCKRALLEGYPFKVLDCCKLDLSEWELNIKHARVLVGTKRPGRISKRLVQSLIDIYGTQCSYCSEDARETYHIDHIKPIAAGGGNDLDNLCIACPKCNLTAGSRVFSTQEGKRRFILRQRGLL